jgi:hypothetical protein
MYIYIYFATTRNTLKRARVVRCRGVVVLNANEVLIRGDRQICKCLDVREGRSALKTSAVMRTGRGRTGPASGEPNRTERTAGRRLLLGGNMVNTCVYVYVMREPSPSELGPPCAVYTILLLVAT